jgi:hypothetical protein
MTTSAGFSVDSTSGIVSKSGYSYTISDVTGTVSAELSLCGATWTTKTATVTQPFASVNVTICGSTSSIRWRYYGTICGDQNGNNISHDFYAGTPVNVAIPVSSLTVTLSGGVWQQMGASGTLNTEPSLTFKKNGTTVGGTTYPTTWSSTQAEFRSYLGTSFTLVPGDTLVATFSAP